MTSKYNSPFSIGKRQTLFLDVNDPRIRGYKAGISASRAGSEIVVVNPDGGSLFGSSFGSSPRIVPKVPAKEPTGKVPGEITNLSAEWQEIDGLPALIFSFEIDLALPDNDTIDSFEYRLTDGVATTPSLSYSKLNSSSIEQQVIFYYSDNTKYFGEFQTTFTEFEYGPYSPALFVYLALTHLASVVDVGTTAGLILFRYTSRYPVVGAVEALDTTSSTETKSYGFTHTSVKLTL